jgi:hypothetical protein
MWHRDFHGVHMYVDREHAMNIEAAVEPANIDGDEELGG